MGFSGPRARVALLGLRAPWGTEGGVEHAVGELAPRLAASGLAVTVYCRGRYNPHGSRTIDGVRLVDSPTVYRRSLEALVHTAVATPHAAATHDLVHFHACGPALFSALPRAAARASVVTLHGKDWEREKWGPAARAALRTGAWVAGRGATEIIAVSRGLAEWCRAQGPARVTFIPNGVSPHRHVAWDPAPFPDLSPGRYHLFLGRLVPEKGLDTLLAAVGRLRPRFPVVITGGGTYTDEYVATLRRSAPPDVVFTGPRHGDEKAMLLSHARSFVLPSRLEGLPIALLEALAAGLPTLASDIAPNREVLGDVPGWRLPPGDADAWARAIAEVERAEPERVAAYAKAGRERVRSTFGWDAVVRATRDVYLRALDR